MDVVDEMAADEAWGGGRSQLMFSGGVWTRAREGLPRPPIIRTDGFF